MSHLKPNLEQSLTETEKAILELIGEGHSSAQIAAIRKCSQRTVEKHRSHIIQKLKLPTSQHVLLVYALNRNSN